MKALGIIAMIMAIVCIFVPGLGPYVTVVAAVLAALLLVKALPSGPWLLD